MLTPAGTLLFTLVAPRYFPSCKAALFIPTLCQASALIATADANLFLECGKAPLLQDRWENLLSKAHILVADRYALVCEALRRKRLKSNAATLGYQLTPIPAAA